MPDYKNAGMTKEEIEFVKNLPPSLKLIVDNMVEANTSIKRANEHLDKAIEALKEFR